jgi:hypothetical protein
MRQLSLRQVRNPEITIKIKVTEVAQGKKLKQNLSIIKDKSYICRKIICYDRRNINNLKPQKAATKSIPLGMHPKIKAIKIYVNGCGCIPNGMQRRVGDLFYRAMHS